LESEDERVYWEIGKFIRLALKANPNIIEVLYSPMVEVCKSEAEELLANRAAFLSKRVYRTYNAYVMSQFKKLEQDLRTQGAVKWKHAMQPHPAATCGMLNSAVGRSHARRRSTSRSPARHSSGRDPLGSRRRLADATPQRHGYSPSRVAITGAAGLPQGQRNARKAASRDNYGL